MQAAYFGPMLLQKCQRHFCTSAAATNTDSTAALTPIIAVIAQQQVWLAQRQLWAGEEEEELDWQRVGQEVDRLQERSGRLDAAVRPHPNPCP